MNNYTIVLLFFSFFLKFLFIFAAHLRKRMEQEKVIFRCFGSGSSGNSYYLGTNREGILIDAGVSARTIHRHLRAIGLDFSRISGVFITHDHADHIRSVGTLGERAHIPIYTTALIHEGIDRNYGLREKLKTSRKYFEKGVEFEFNGMTVNTFGVSHDSTDCLGYKIRLYGQTFVLITDCGEPNAEIEQAIREANHLVIEANHDEQLLLKGSYPTYLKQRILSPRGHQSNQTCGQLLADNFHEGLRNVFLCHLSQENNDPDLAYHTISEATAQAGWVAGEDYFLKVLDRLVVSPVYVLGDSMIEEQPKHSKKEQEQI